MESPLLQNIIAIRRFLQLTKKEFGEAIGVSESHISRIESGDRDPSAKFIEAICEKFHIKPGTIYGVNLEGQEAATVAHSSIKGGDNAQ